MKRTIFAAMALLGIALTAAAQEPKPVKGQGCVAAGVEANCLVLKDVKTGVLYNLYFKGTKPEIGAGIEFKGTARDPFTICMQGKPVEVTVWSRVDSLQCASGQSPKPQTPKP
jgi:hypothetical protein